MSGETFLDGRVTLHCGDSRDVLDTLEPESIDNCVCDPPYALVSIGKRFGKPGAAPASGNDAYARASAGFMGQSWDTGEVAFSAEFWRKVWRVLKPGGHVIAFGGTRAYHRLAVAIEDAGFEIRDSIADAISLDPVVRSFVGSLSEAQLDAFLRIADLIGFEGLLAWVYGTGFPKSHNLKGEYEGWGTALKPAWEPIVLARKPLIGTVAANVLAHGTGALNIDGCRVGSEVVGWGGGAAGGGTWTSENCGLAKGGAARPVQGRHPANVIHDGSAEVVGAFPQNESPAPRLTKRSPDGDARNSFGAFAGQSEVLIGYGDSGSAARFFYSAKADADDRIGSKHPTVKPVDLMQWVVRLVTAKGGVVLDPFAGTGTTGEAAWREGCRAVLIERKPEFQEDIRRRLALCTASPAERKRASALAKNADKPADLGPLFSDGEAAE